MQDRFKFRMWDGFANKYFDEETDPLFENVYECMKQQIFYNSGNPLYGKLAYNHAKDGRVFEQCTGLKDKNDRFIYDNDLIMIGNKLYRVAIDDFGCRTVILDNNPFKEVIEWSDIVKIYYFHNRVDEIEVVGNIRENKDLLENKDE